MAGEKKKMQPVEEHDFISSSKAADEFKRIFGDQMKHEDTRQRIKDIIIEYVGSVEFMRRVQMYAADEMDKRVFRSTKYWSTVILTAMATSIIGLLIGKYLK